MTALTEMLLGGERMTQKGHTGKSCDSSVFQIHKLADPQAPTRVVPGTKQDWAQTSYLLKADERTY